MNEWTVLTKENVPPNIGYVQYEWEWDNLINEQPDNPWTPCGWSTIVIFLNLWKRRVTRKFRFRECEPKPKQPTHPEIMIKFWQCISDKSRTGIYIWKKVETYREDEAYFILDHWQNKQWFIGKESADIPPENNNVL